MTFRDSLHTSLFDLYTIVDGGGDMTGVRYSGSDMVEFYIFLFKNYFSEYSWQVRLCYLVVLGCCITMIVVFSLFLRSVFRRKKKDREAQKIREQYYEPFLTILGNDSLKPSEMEEILGHKEEELAKLDSTLLAELLMAVRMEIYEVVYLPNFQRLADLAGVRALYEDNLLRERSVFQTLQTLCMFQLIISEGRLANYVNSPDPDIRMMARMCYILCSMNEPYRYLLEDLDKQQPLMRPMLLHYIFGWMKSQDRHMPNFLALSDRVKNGDMSAYLIREVAYWGSDEEKDLIPNYFLAERHECRSAAIAVCGQLGRVEQEDRLLESYVYQPEAIRRDVLRAVLAINSGKRTQFFVDVYHDTPSRDTRELALTCLYSYGSDGRNEFEKIRSTVPEEERVMMEQIDSANLLVQIQAYS